MVARTSPARLRTRRRLISANATDFGVPIVACRSRPAISGAWAHNRADALRVVGFEKAAIFLVEHDFEDLRFGQRLADPITGIGHAGEHRSIAIGHYHDGARRKRDVRESRREPVQVLHREDDPFELSRRAHQRVGIVDRGTVRDAADLIVADGEVVHLQRHLEVRAIRDIDGCPETEARCRRDCRWDRRRQCSNTAGTPSSISARNALHAAASFVWSCGSRANAVSNWRAASIWAAWLLVTMRMSRIASSLTLAMAALRSSACVYAVSTSHGTSIRSDEGKQVAPASCRSA